VSGPAPIPAALLTLSRAARRRVLALVRRSRWSRWQLPALAARELADLEPRLARVLRGGQVLEFLRAAVAQVKEAGVEPARPSSPHQIVPPPPPPITLPATPGDPDPPAVFPQVERAARFLQTRIDYTPAEFARLDADARQVAFTVAKAVTLDAVEKVRRAVLEDVRGGGTLKEFRAKVEEAMGESALAPHQVEAIYRTQAARAYSAGQQDVLAHPLVADEFPYLAYEATHDGRVRPEHLAMERLGLNGTNVYRRDDPIWFTFYPPWGWNCRCVVIPLTVEDAAGRGVGEARGWLMTGRPPVVPEFVKPPPFDLPKGWVPVGRRLAVAV